MAENYNAIIHNLAITGCLGPLEFRHSVYDSESYITTGSFNKVSKKALLRGTTQIRIKGKSIVKEVACIRGDLGAVNMGMYCILEERSLIRPCSRYSKSRGELSYLPSSIGDHVFIGKHSVIESFRIGSYVLIGQNSVIGLRSEIRDCAIILPNSVVPSDTVVPSYTVFGGNPAQMVCQIANPSIDSELERFTVSYYNSFVSESVKDQCIQLMCGKGKG